MPNKEAKNVAADAAMASPVDVLIVGYGPVGATLGLLLGQYGLKVLLIDKAAEMQRIPRAIGLDNEALRILQMVGLNDAAFPRRPAHELSMQSRFGGRFLSVQIAGVIDAHSKFVSFFQPDLENALRAQLATYPNVQTKQSMEFLEYAENDDGVVVQLQDEHGKRHAVQSKYLVGADGASSPVREQMGLSFSGKTYIEDWLIVDVKQPPQAVKNPGFICNPERPLVVIPAPEGRQRWEFMLHPGEDPQAMLEADSIRRLLAPWGRPEDMDIERKAVYRFHARCCDTFQKGRVFLAGDAAHVTPPFVGQGLVSGLRDVANLAWKLNWVLRERASEDILESYSLERRPHAEAMINLATMVGHFVMPKNRLMALFSHGLMRLLRLLPGVRGFFDELKIKPKNSYPKGLFQKGGSRLQRGALLPQCWLRKSDGSVCRSDDILGQHMCLLSFGPNPRDLLDPASLREWEASGGRLVQIVMNDQQVERGDEAFEDIDGQLLGDHVPYGWAAVVRPDRFVLTDGPANQAATLLRQTRRLLAGSQNHSFIPEVSPVRS